jgi:KUP system potassium uptake protein
MTFIYWTSNGCRISTYIRRQEFLPRGPPLSRTRRAPRAAGVILHYGYMESPRVPAALASLRKAGLKIDIMTTSFYLGRWSNKPAPNSGMPLWQDRLFIMLSRQAANATGFFAIPSDRVVELGAQVTV